tara:strand:- start:143 stop:394 length:252 start_codon:yes stop_codon:yes gene_type:complete
MYYRDVEYTLKTWVTNTGEVCTCYSCSDTELLNDLSITEFQDVDEVELFFEIDYYLDQRKLELSREKLRDEAAKEFYKLNKHR